MTTAFNISSSDVENGKAMTGISYSGLLGFLIAVLTSRENRFVIFHAQQSLIPTILVFIRFLSGVPPSSLTTLPGWPHLCFSLSALSMASREKFKTPLTLLLYRSDIRFDVDILFRSCCQSVVKG